MKFYATAPNASLRGNVHMNSNLLATQTWVQNQSYVFSTLSSGLNVNHNITSNASISNS